MEKIKILIVDDESRMRKLVKDFLGREGYLCLLYTSVLCFVRQKMTSHSRRMQPTQCACAASAAHLIISL